MMVTAVMGEGEGGGGGSGRYMVTVDTVMAENGRVVDYNGDGGDGSGRGYAKGSRVTTITSPSAQSLRWRCAACLWGWV